MNIDITWSNQKVFQHICLTSPEISKQVFIYTPSPAPPIKGGVRLLPLVSAVMSHNSDLSDYSGYLHYRLSLKFGIHRQGEYFTHRFFGNREISFTVTEKFKRLL